MKINGRDITNMLHTRGFAVLVTVAALVATIVAYADGEVIPIEGNRGVLFPSPNLWFPEGVTSLLLNLLSIVLVGFATIFINRQFNIMRAQTALWATLFVVMVCALPTVAGQFYGGALVSLMMTGVSIVMFTCFGDPARTRRIFLMFFFVTVGALFQYAMAFFLAVLVLGLAQMRVLTLKSLIAGGFGFVTPLWILFGSGLKTWADIRLPHFVWTLSALSGPEMALSFGCIGFTLLLGIGMMAANLVKVISYNAQCRSANGFLSIMLMAVAVLLFIDFNNLSIYVPLLCMLTAYQTAHFFSNHRNSRSFIWIALIVAFYCAIYAAAYLL